MEQQTEEQFYEKYTTIPNHIRNNENNEWETYGEELEYVRNIMLIHPERVFTKIDNNDGWYGIVAGYHWINRINYLIVQEGQGWEDENEEYTIYDTTELREQWENLPAQAIEEITGVSIVDADIDEDEYEDHLVDTFYMWEEMDETERQQILDKYKKQ